MCPYMVKKDLVEKTKNGDIVTRFWYTLKKLHLSVKKYRLQCLMSVFESLLFIEYFSNLFACSNDILWILH
jgi:hypothetical protein